MAHFLRSLRAGCHFRRGQWRAAQGRFEQAAQEYERALALDPTLPFVPLHYALLEADQGRFDAALRRLQRGLEQQPDSPVYRTFQAWLLAQAGRLEAAQQALEQALARTPTNTLTRNGEAYLLFRRGQPDRAVACLRRDGLCSNQAMQARLLLELEKALLAGQLPPPGPAAPPPACFSRLPASPKRCLRRGIKLLEKGRPAEAVALLERAQERLAGRSEVGFYLGAAYFEAGRYAEARRVLEAERQRHPEPDPGPGPRVDPFWLYLAATYLRLGQLEAGEAALQHAPDGPDTDFCRGLAALRRGREPQAIRFFQQALHRDGSLLQRRLADLAPSAGKEGP
jgi:tetratricopeptide (TPR) repeat protein